MLLALMRRWAGDVGTNPSAALELPNWVRKIIHGPALAALVKATTTPYDDVALEFLKSLVPVPD